MENPIVNRNNIAKTFAPAEWGKKSPNAGKTFFTPVISEPQAVTAKQAFDKDPEQTVLVNIADFLWFGLSEIAAWLNPTLRRAFGDIAVDNTNEDTGEFDLEGWKRDAAAFTQGVQKLSDVKEQIEQLNDLMQTYIMDDEFGATTDGTETGQKTARAIELEELMKEANARTRPLKAQKVAIEKEYAERAAKREARKQKEEVKPAA